MARAWKAGSIKSGPTLKACTARPRRWSASNSPSVTVVFPTPLETPAMTRTGTISDARIDRSNTPADSMLVVHVDRKIVVRVLPDPVEAFPALPGRIDMDRDATKMRHVME